MNKRESEPRQLVPVSDRAAITATIREVAAARGDTPEQARCRLDVSQPTYSRYAGGKIPKRIDVGFLQRLAKLCSDAQREQLARAWIDDGARFALGQHVCRMADTLAAVGQEDVALDFGPVAPGARDLRTWRLDATPVKRRAALHRLVKWLHDRPQYHGHVATYLKRWRRRGFQESHPRVAVAFYQALEPLLAWDLGDHVELGWAELHGSGELEAYLKAAFAREDILLDRGEDLDRAQALGRDQPQQGEPPLSKRRRRTETRARAKRRKSGGRPRGSS